MVNKDNDILDDVEDITAEDTDLAAEEPELETIEDLEGNKIKSLKEKITRLDEEKRAALEQLAAAKADFLNARKRLEEDKQRGIERQKIKDIEAVLPLADSFDMAMRNKEVWEKADASWRKGIEGIYAQLQQVLSGYGVTATDPTGEPFNPLEHEAMGTQSVDDKTKDHEILQVLQPGYKLGDTVIRPARVITGIFNE